MIAECGELTAGMTIGGQCCTIEGVTAQLKHTAAAVDEKVNAGQARMLFCRLLQHLQAGACPIDQADVSVRRQTAEQLGGGDSGVNENECWRRHCTRSCHRQPQGVGIALALGALRVALIEMENGSVGCSTVEQHTRLQRQSGSAGTGDVAELGHICLYSLLDAPRGKRLLNLHKCKKIIGQGNSGNCREL